MTSILFLDDSPDRAETMLAQYPETIWVQTASETIQKLSQEQWHVVCLDHDLGGETFVDPNREDCGMEVVRWIEQAMPTIGKIIVHTWNYPAAKQMVARLRRKDYVVILQPFWSSGWSV